MKDPFEAACEEQEQESPPESPIQGDDDVPASAADAIDDQEAPGLHPADEQEQQQPEAEDDEAAATAPSSSSAPVHSAAVAAITARKGKDEDDQEEEEENINMPRKLPSGADPDKMAKMQAILSQFTEEQMSRYESFRRSGFQKSNMKKLLASIIGSQKISVPMTIVVSGIAKMFVGELVETGRTVMMERKETGPLRPCHIREAYRRLKLEGKVPRRSVPRLFR